MTGLTADFLSSLRERGVRVSVEGDRLVCDAPPGVLDEGLRTELAARKSELMALFSESETGLSAHSLVPLKQAGDYPPIFARPGHNGDVFCYRHLAAHLDPRQPLYGVEPKGVDGSNSTPATVEEIAAYEVAQIRTFQPEGPYYVAGFCAGGAITFEAARQLSEAGAEVARVLLFASPFPTTYRTSALRQYGRSVVYRARRHAARATGGSFRDGLEYVGSRARRRVARAGATHDAALLAVRRRVEEATMAAVKLYDPPFYGGRVDIFLPSEAWRQSGDEPGWWDGVAADVVEHVGPDGCDGDDMLLEPHVGAIAALLNDALEDDGRAHAAN